MRWPPRPRRRWAISWSNGGAQRLEVAKRPTQAARRDEHLAEARKWFTEAAHVFSTSEARFDAELKKFPQLIDPKDRGKIEARDQARLDVIQSQLMGATAQYELTKTWPKDSEDRKKLLETAAAKYHELYEKYFKGERKLLAGLYARVSEGRCQLDAGNAAKALTIFDEILSQPEKPDDFHLLKRKALPLALEAWIDEKEKKFDKAIETGESWLKDAAGPEEKLADGLAIHWWTAQAYLRRAAAHQEEDRQKTDDLQAAARHAAFVAKAPGEYQAAAKEIVGQLRKTPGAEAEPNNFAEARARAKQTLDEMAVVDQQVKQTKRTGENKEQLPEFEKSKAALLETALRYYRLALDKKWTGNLARRAQRGPLFTSRICCMSKAALTTMPPWSANSSPASIRRGSPGSPCGQDRHGRVPASVQCPARRPSPVRNRADDRAGAVSGRDVAEFDRSG